MPLGDGLSVLGRRAQGASPARRPDRRPPRRFPHHHPLRPSARQPRPARQLHRRRLSFDATSPVSQVGRGAAWSRWRPASSPKLQRLRQQSFQLTVIERCPAEVTIVDVRVDDLRRLRALASHPGYELRLTGTATGAQRSSDCDVGTHCVEEDEADHEPERTTERHGRSGPE